MAKIRTILLTSLGTVALLASLAAAGTLYVTNSKLEKTKLDQANKIATLETQNKGLTKDKGAQDLRIVELERTIKELSPENTELKENIGAFATQAASCDTLKKSLNIKS
jgi:hypothetical protein